jgi:hypothetical protein
MDVVGPGRIAAAVRPPVLVPLLSLLVMLTGCASAPEEPDLPSLAEVAGTIGPLAPVGPTGPPLDAACPLLTPRQVGAALGRPTPTSREDPGGSGPDGEAFTCSYTFGDSYLQLMAFTYARTAAPTARYALNRTLIRYTGTLEELPGVGDAAMYLSAGDGGTLYVAKDAGQEVRVISLWASRARAPRDGLIELARAALERM